MSLFFIFPSTSASGGHLTYQFVVGLENLYDVASETGTVKFLNKNLNPSKNHGHQNLASTSPELSKKFSKVDSPMVQFPHDTAHVMSLS